MQFKLNVLDILKITIVALIEVRAATVAAPELVETLKPSMDRQKSRVLETVAAS
jgi:hypothetical protein